jgi:hypothetical protein
MGGTKKTAILTLASGAVHAPVSSPGFSRFLRPDRLKPGLQTAKMKNRPVSDGAGQLTNQSDVAPCVPNPHDPNDGLSLIFPCVQPARSFCLFLSWTFEESLPQR